MTPRRIIGAVLIVLGIAGLALGGFSWTRTKTVVDLGPLQATAQEKKTLPIPPLVSGLLLVAGVALLLVPGGRR